MTIKKYFRYIKKYIYKKKDVQEKPEWKSSFIKMEEDPLHIMKFPSLFKATETIFIFFNL